MKNFLLTLSFVVFSSSSFAIGNFTSETGVLVIRNLSVDGTRTYDSVKLQLNLTNGTFTILDTTLDINGHDDPNSFSKTPIDTFISDNIKIDFMGCILTGTDLELRKHQIMCKTQVVSLNGDEEINAPGNELNKLIDNLGNEYTRQSTIIALDKPSSGVTKFNAIQGIPVSVMYVFNGIDFAATAISTFKPTFHIRNSNILINSSFQFDLKLPQFE